MSTNENLESRVRRHRRTVVAGVLGAALVGTSLVASTAGAANGGFPMAYNAETAPGYTNTFTPAPTDLKPACPQALAGTPGSDPASKVLNDALNTPASFQPGGTVHFTYGDNPHTNGGTANFTIQDCVVAYPAGTFTSSDIGPGGVLLNATKSQLKGGTQIDGAELNGISQPTGPIYYSYTLPTTVAAGTWICTFARDIRNNHGGGGNRKVPPTCFVVTRTPPPPPPNVDSPPAAFVAYVDDFHDRATGQTIPFTPSPWMGDPSVVYVGCTTAAQCGKFDGGAIRLDNAGTNAATLTVTGASVTVGACTFTPWGTLLPKSFAPGQSLILTQTGTLGLPQPSPCKESIDPMWWPYTNFDTSERPFDNRGAPTPADRKFDCDTSTGATPVINVTYSNGTTTKTIHVNDTGKVLNTGGTDSQACFSQNEAAGWTGPLSYTP